MKISYSIGYTGFENVIQGIKEAHIIKYKSNQSRSAKIQSSDVHKE